jgi:hypothetical protein
LRRPGRPAGAALAGVRITCVKEAIPRVWGGGVGGCSRPPAGSVADRGLSRKGMPSRPVCWQWPAGRLAKAPCKAWFQRRLLAGCGGRLAEARQPRAPNLLPGVVDMARERADNAIQWVLHTGPAHNKRAHNAPAAPGSHVPCAGCTPLAVHFLLAGIF